MSQSSMNQSALNEIGRGGVLVVAQWEAKEGKADAVVATLRRFLPQAQSEPGVKLFLIGQGKDNPSQFLFYELFDNDDAFVAHQASEYFKSLYRRRSTSASFQAGTQTIFAAVTDRDDVAEPKLKCPNSGEF